VGPTALSAELEKPMRTFARARDGNGADLSVDQNVHRLRHIAFAVDIFCTDESAA
jgi:hypothetical protein